MAEEDNDLLTLTDDIVAVSQDLSPARLVAAYRKGIFPWPLVSDLGFKSQTNEVLDLIPWFCPLRRAVLFYERLHGSRSFQKFLRKSKFRCTFNRAFSAVIRNCAGLRADRSRTWITSAMMEAYEALHKNGAAHSVEVWRDESSDELVGGLYGVAVDGVFSAESMYYHQPNASKFALWFLMQHLWARGLHWIDVQTMSPHLKKWGAITLDRKSFLILLRQTQALGLDLFPRSRH